MKEHIKSLKELTLCRGHTLVISQETIDTIKELIVLLQQGEKYRLMWEELRHNYGWIGYEGIPHINSNSIAYVSKIMDDVEQKYFPKETNQDIKKAINESN